jgi:hypothetical protein
MSLQQALDVIENTSSSIGQSGAVSWASRSNCAFARSYRWETLSVEPTFGLPRALLGSQLIKKQARVKVAHLDREVAVWHKRLDLPQGEPTKMIRDILNGARRKL